jgi:ArsR family transcriptional regulator
METNQAVKAFAALANANRLAIFRVLLQAGEAGLAAGEIAKALALPNATLSFHLKELVHAELILARPESRFIFYSVNVGVMNDLIGFLTENCCNGVGCGLDVFECEVALPAPATKAE